MLAHRCSAFFSSSLSFSDVLLGTFLKLKLSSLKVYPPIACPDGLYCFVLAGSASLARPLLVNVADNATRNILTHVMLSKLTIV